MINVRAIGVMELKTAELIEAAEGGHGRPHRWKVCSTSRLAESDWEPDIEGEMVWFPEDGRAIVLGFETAEWSEGAGWTEAEGPADAVSRYVNGSVQP